MDLEVLSLRVSDGRVMIKNNNNSIRLSRIMAGGSIRTKTPQASGDMAGEFDIRGHSWLKGLTGQHGRFMISGLNYHDNLLSVTNFLVSNRLSGRFTGTLPLGHGPFSMDIYRAFVPDGHTGAWNFHGLKINGMSASMSGIDGELLIESFGVKNAVLNQARIQGLFGRVKISASLFTGLSLENARLWSRQFNASLQGESQSPMTAAILKTSVVIWDARGDFLRASGLYPQAELGRFYSGVGTLEIQLTPLRLKSPKIHWVVQWSPVF
jgi:hypothetical protein